MSSVVNETLLDYSLVKYVNLPHTNTVLFYAGTMFPNNENLVSAVWTFGDGTTRTTAFIVNEARYNRVVNAFQDHMEFFPRWSPNGRSSAGLVVPRFEITHHYKTPGTYEVSVKLIDKNGISYTGESVYVTTLDDEPKYAVPFNWDEITNDYILSNSVELLSKGSSGGIPEVSSLFSSAAILPIDVSFNITNLLGRTDIDFIEWSFGDGTTDVISILGSAITQQLTENNYSYQLMPAPLVYEPSVVIYFSNKLKIKLQVPQVPLIDISNITEGVNSSSNTSFNLTTPFNITPTKSSLLPVDTKFIHVIQPDLKYIIWNYVDGTYDVIPVAYAGNISNILQTVTVNHKYTSVNHFTFVPKCLLVYENADGTFRAESYRSRSVINYQLGVLNPQADQSVSRVNSITNYQARNNISSLIEYPATNTGYATVYLRLTLGIKSKHILYFEKIVWKINDKVIVTDKNTTERFGTLTLHNIPTEAIPSSPLLVTAEIYGMPHIYADIENYNLLILYDSYEREVFVIDKDIQDQNNAIVASNLLLLPPDLNPETVILDNGDIEIVTPIFDSEITVDISDDDVVFVGSNLIFDNLFKADAPASNFLNRLFPSTASIPSDILVSKRVVGFFRPTKTSPIIVDPGNFTFTIRLESIEFNKPYYIPDPFKYGSNTDAVSFNSLDQSFKKNARFGKARNEPNQPADSVSFYGYNSNKINNDISSIFDMGYIHDGKRDLFGNTYGVLKDNNNFRENIDLTLQNTILTLQLNGYRFYDDIFGEADSFNYALTGTFGNETIRSGLSSNTNGLTGRPESFFTLNFGDFIRISKYTEPTEVIGSTISYINPKNVAVRDGGYFAVSENNLLPDPISSDSPSWPGSGVYYYNTLLESGVHNATPYTRPLLSTLFNSQSAIFTQNVRVSANNSIFNIDGGLYNTKYNITDQFFSTGPIDFIDNVNPTSLTSFVSGVNIVNETKSSRDSLSGTIIVKEASGSVDTFLNKLPYLQDKYLPTVYSSLTSGIINFELAYNTYCLQTNNYVIFDSINYTAAGYINPKTANIALEYNNNLFNTVSNRYKVGDNIYVAILSTFGTITPDIACVYPIIYRLNIYSLDLEQIFPATANISAVSSAFTVSASGVLYTESSSPYITYNTDLEMFNISYILKDQNKLPYLMSTYFRDRRNNIIANVNGFSFGKDNITTQFNNISTLNNFNILLSSGTFTISSALIL